MEFNQFEVNAIALAAETQEPEILEVEALQLAFVGGGIADVIGA